MDGKGLLWRISSLFVLLQITSSGAVTYADYDIASDRVCSRLGKRELSISMSRPVLVREGGRLLSNWPGKHFFSCRFEIEAKGRGLGAVAVVQKLKLRKLGMECVDYLQTTNTTVYQKTSPIGISGTKFKIKKKGNKAIELIKKTVAKAFDPTTNTTMVRSGDGLKFKIKKKKKEDKAKKLIKETIKKAFEPFKEDKETNRGPRLCGSMMFGHQLGINGSLPAPPPSPLPPLPPSTENTALSILSTIFKGAVNRWSGVVSRGAVVDPKGELKTYVYVDNRALRSDETLELVVAYTGYQECDGRKAHPSLFHCGYGLCVSSLVVNDGVVNCPFGDCADEVSCSSAMASNLTAWILRHSTAKRSSDGVSTGVTATSSFFAIAILMTIGACICFILRRNKKRKEAQLATEGTVYHQQNGNGEYVGVPTMAGGQTMGAQGDQMPSGAPGQPMMPPSQPEQQPGGIGFRVPGSNDQPYPGAGAPYPGAGAPYPGAGAPYPGAGAPYPGAGAPYPGAGAPYPGAGAPYPGAGAPYPGAGAPYPGAGTPYPGGNTPYPFQPPPSMPPPAGGDTSAPTAPASQESPPPYTSLFPQPKN